MFMCLFSIKNSPFRKISSHFKVPVAAHLLKLVITLVWPYSPDLLTLVFKRDTQMKSQFMFNFYTKGDPLSFYKLKVGTLIIPFLINYFVISC